VLRNRQQKHTAKPLATSGKKDNYAIDISLLLDKYRLKIKYADTQADPKV